ncbi:MAG: rhomboid family intramembrane serine protease [Ectobacillus sp.]
MHNRQDSLYWAILYVLVSLGRYELLYYSEKEQEAWLETKQLHEAKIIRFKRSDVDWSRWIRNDLYEIEPIVKQMMKRGLRAKPKLYNVYISQWSPVDDWQSVVKEAKQSLGMQTLFFTEENGGQEEEFLQTALKLSAEEAAAVLALQEEEPQVLRYRLGQILRARKQEQEQILSYAKPLFTKMLVAVQIIMFLILEWYGGSTSTATLVTFGAKYNPLIIQGEWWRFFTPMFLHIGFLHLLMNTVALYYIGSQVERILGNIRFIIVYLFAGFSGSVLSFVMSDDVSAGASGAIFGCFGALVYIARTYSKVFSKTVMQSVLTLIGVNLIFGFVVPGIDNAGHIGGLIGGFLAAAFVHVPKRKLPFFKRAGIFLLSLGVLAGLLFYGFYAYRNDPHMLIYEAKEALKEKDMARAEQLLHQAVQLENVPLEAHYLLGYVYGAENNVAKAKEQLQFVLAKRTNDDPSHYLMALLYLRENNMKQASHHANQALKLQPYNEKYKELAAEIERIIEESALD